MSDDNPAGWSELIEHLERCLMILAEAKIPSPDLDFLQAFLTNAKGYLSKDVSPDTEALENWDSPENQAMIRRYVTHVEAEIRLMVEEWRQAYPDQVQTPLGEKMSEMVNGLGRLTPESGQPNGSYQPLRPPRHGDHNG